MRSPPRIIEQKNDITKFSLGSRSERGGKSASKGMVRVDCVYSNQLWIIADETILWVNWINQWLNRSRKVSFFSLSSRLLGCNVAKYIPACSGSFSYRARNCGAFPRGFRLAIFHSLHIAETPTSNPRHKELYSSFVYLLVCLSFSWYGVPRMQKLRSPSVEN